MGAELMMRDGWLVVNSCGVWCSVVQCGAVGSNMGASSSWGGGSRECLSRMSLENGHLFIVRSPVSLLVFFSLAGGAGLNLVGASRLILLEPGWNPAKDAQVLGRIWRPGQNRPCFNYRLMCCGTLEERQPPRPLPPPLPPPLNTDTPSSPPT